MQRTGCLDYRFQIITCPGNVDFPGGTRISQSLGRSGRVRKRRVEKSNRCRENNCRASITRYGNAIRIPRCTEASDGRNYLMGYRYPVFNTYVLVTRAFPRLPVLAVHGNRVSYMCTMNYTRGKTEGEVGKKGTHLGKTRREEKPQKLKMTCSTRGTLNYRCLHLQSSPSEPSCSNRSYSCQSFSYANSASMLEHFSCCNYAFVSAGIISVPTGCFINLGNK